AWRTRRSAGAPAAALAGDSFFGLSVEQQQLVSRNRELQLLAGVHLLLDRELCLNRRVPAGQMHELLVAEILHDLDARVEVHAVRPTVAEVDVLGPETCDASVCAGTVQDLGRHEVHGGGTDEAGD